jgi:hypothetical protein
MLSAISPLRGADEPPSPRPRRVAPIPDALWELLLLTRALRTVAARSSDQQLRIRQLADAVDERLAVVEALKTGNHLPSSLVLLRDAATLAARAVLEARGLPTTDCTLEEAFRKLDSVLQTDEHPPKPEALRRARELLGDPRNLVFDALSPADASLARSEVQATTEWLRGLVDARSAAEIRASRLCRWGALAGLALGILGGGIRCATPQNIALGKPVQASSRRPNCPSGSGDSGLPPSGLVDGSKGKSFDICTNYEVRPWVKIELEAVHRISKVMVYNRGDGGWGLNDLPVVLELSVDGVNFAEIGRRTTPYTASDPWTVSASGQRAAVVRLRVDSDGPRELVLNEIEVFAR